MKQRRHIDISCVFLLVILLTNSYRLKAQQNLLFGTVKVNGTISQARFETDSVLSTIIFAPYGRTPISFTDIRKTGGQLNFNWNYYSLKYACTLNNASGKEYRGTCSNAQGQSIELVMREFTPEDAAMQGNSLRASRTDLFILDRALALLNNGKNWSSSDNRICDSSSYPYKWSLFCALHQASLDVDGEYRHLRPAMQMTREAINEATSGKKFSHMLQDFNREAQGFESIQGVLVRAKEMIQARMNDMK